jgi:hypothetical protein
MHREMRAAGLIDVGLLDFKFVPGRRSTGLPMQACPRHADIVGLRAIHIRVPPRASSACNHKYRNGDSLFATASHLIPEKTPLATCKRLSLRRSYSLGCAYQTVKQPVTGIVREVTE